MGLSFNMKAQDTFAFLWIPILLHCIRHTRTQEVFFSISRTRPHGDDGWTNGVDRFNIPSTMCPQNPNRTCAYFSGSTVAHANCTCECLSTKTTFAFTDGRWQCQSNANNEMQARLQSVQYSKHDEKGKWNIVCIFVFMVKIAKGRLRIQISKKKIHDDAGVLQGKFQKLIFRTTVKNVSKL